MNPYEDQPREPDRPEPTEPPSPTSSPTSSPLADPWWSRPDDASGGAGDRATGIPDAEQPSWTPLAAEPTGPRRNRLRSRLRSGTALTVSAVVLSAAVTGTVVHVVDDHGSRAAVSSSATSVQNLPAAADVSPSVKSALAKIEPSVVIINDTVTSGGRGGFGGFGGFQQSGAGTGIIISSDGEVVTNAHVVNGASNIKVTVAGGGTHSASLVGLDTSRDLAVIKVSGVSGLKPATFANSDSVQVGDSVIAVGNALGYGGSPTVTEGIISAKGRSLSDSTSDLSGLLQTDAAINPGNSGGPLVDVNGDVVGINVAVATGNSAEPAQNIGFAIPSNTVVANLPALKAGKNAAGTNQTTAFLGVQVTDADGGAGVVAVQPGSPADNAGLRAGDVITKLGNATIGNASDLQKAVRGHQPGDTVTLTVQRGGGTTTLHAKLGSTQVSS